MGVAGYLLGGWEKFLCTAVIDARNQLPYTCKVTSFENVERLFVEGYIDRKTHAEPCEPIIRAIRIVNDCIRCLRCI